MRKSSPVYLPITLTADVIEASKADKSAFCRLRGLEHLAAALDAAAEFRDLPYYPFLAPDEP